MILRALAARLVAGGVAVGLLTGCAGTQAVQSGPAGGDARYVAGSGASQVYPAAERKPAPKVAGVTLDGTPLSLTDHRGKVIVLNFWASWCAPCRAEAPALVKISAATERDGVRFVGVDIKDGRQPARAFVRNFKVGYPSLYDQPGQVALAFRDTVPPQAIPSTIIIDRQGRIAARVIGGVTYSVLSRLVDQVAAESA